MSEVPVYRVRVDAKRRPTLPQELLDAAGVGVNTDVVARLEGPGRIVLEAPAIVLARLQEAVRAGTDQRAADAGAEELPGDGVDESAAPPPAGADPAPATRTATGADAGAER